MELLTPAGLAALALALPLTALWFRRRRRVARAVSSLQLWRAVGRALPPQTGLRRLVTERAWWLHLAALTLVSLALAAPTLRVVAEAPQRLALVVDTTASMGARADGRSRLDEARALARRALDALPRGSEVAVIEAGCEAALTLPATRDISLARNAIDALRARDCGGDITRALALAAERLRGAARPRLVALTDGVARTSRAWTSPVPAEVLRVGRIAPNVGVVAAELRVEEDGGGASLFVSLAASHSGAGRDLRVRAELLRGNAFVPVAARRVRLAEGRTALTLPLALDPHETADLLRVTLDHDPDALAVDDVAWTPIPRGARIAVRLVREGASPWLSRALRADPAVTLEALTPAQWRVRATERFDGLTIFHGAAPADAPSGASLGFVDDAQTPRALGFTLGPTIAGGPWTDVAEADPRVRFVGVADVHVGAARRIATSPVERALIRSREGVVVAARDDVGGTATLAGFDPDRGDWPLRPGFVLFVRAAVEHARARRDALRLDARRAGAVLRIAAEVPSVGVVHESGVAISVPVHAGVAAWSQTDRAGLWRVDRGRGEERVALSLLDPVESALVENEIPGAQAVDSRQSIARRAPWSAAWLLALGALGALLGDLRRLTRGAPR